MRRVYISCLYRLEDLSLFTGELGRIYVLDWDTKEFLNTPVGVVPGYNLNRPLGKSHGARGVTFHDGFLYVAGSGSKISKFNIDTYDLVKVLDFDCFSNLHQIKDNKGVLYIVSSGTDSVFRVKGDKIVGETKLSKWKDVIEPFVPFVNKQWGSGRLHFNSINWNSSGEELHTYYSPGMVFNATRGEVVFCDTEVLCMPHDVLCYRGYIIVNSSFNRSTVCIKEDTFEYIILYPDTISCNGVEDGMKNRYGFTRALCVIDDTVLVGSTPGRISSMEYSDGKFSFGSFFDFSTTPYESIYDMYLDPRDFESGSI